MKYNLIEKLGTSPLFLMGLMHIICRYLILITEQETIIIKLGFLLKVLPCAYYKSNKSNLECSFILDF